MPNSHAVDTTHQQKRWPQAERLVFGAMIVHSRPDVVASIWALGLVAFYYIATILTYYLLQNLLGYAAFDASVLQGTPQVSLAPFGSTPL